MGYGKFIEDMIDQRLLDMHTAYIGKVLSVNGSTATVQPLGMYKQYGETAKKQAVVSAVVSQNAKYKITPSGESAVFTPLQAGDVVLCICCDRDITEAKNGLNSLPAIGHHSLSDSVIACIL